LSSLHGILEIIINLNPKLKVSEHFGTDAIGPRHFGTGAEVLKCPSYFQNEKYGHTN